MRHVTLSLLLAAALVASVHGAVSDEEMRLVDVISNFSTDPDQGGTPSLASVDAACARLKLIGGEASIPALKSLLLNSNVSHSARYALQSMPSPKAGAALVESLGMASGQIRVGLIHSLGCRGETAAVPALLEILTQGDSIAAIEAARALGRIAPADTKRLQAIYKDTVVQKNLQALRGAIADALIQCAYAEANRGELKRARASFERLWKETDSEPATRRAAFRGLVLTSGDRAADLLVRSLRSEDGLAREAALQLIHEIPGKEATREFAEALGSFELILQPAVIRGLAQRGDPAAVPALLDLLGKGEKPVQLAAAQALGLIGGTAAVLPLIRVAAVADPSVQPAAREALVTLGGRDPTHTLIRILKSPEPALQAEAALALGQRGHGEAIPALLKAAQSSNGQLEKAAAHALGQLAGADVIPALVDLVVQSPTESARAASAGALQVAVQRSLAKDGRVAPETILRGLNRATGSAKVALLGVTPMLAGPEVAQALRTAAQNSDVAVKAAAFNAMCDSSDPAVIGDLTEAAANATELRDRAAAVRAAVRLAGPEHAAQLTPDARLAVHRRLLQLPLRPEEKRVVLSGLAELPVLGSLEATLAVVPDGSVRTEALGAAAKILSGLKGADAEAASALVRKTGEETADPAVKAALTNIATPK